MVRGLVALIALILIVIFALSNQQPVSLGMWPTGVQIEIPLAWAVLGASALAFIVGALITWAGQLRAGSRARRAERQVEQLQDQLQLMREQAERRPVRTPGTAVMASGA